MHCYVPFQDREFSLHVFITCIYFACAFGFHTNVILAHLNFLSELMHLWLLSTMVHVAIIKHWFIFYLVGGIVLGYCSVVEDKSAYLALLSTSLIHPLAISLNMQFYCLIQLISAFNCIQPLPKPFIYFSIVVKNVDMINIVDINLCN